MSVLIVDASVWVSAADATDALSQPSRAFLAALAARATPVALPDFAELEVACALARRLQDAGRGMQLAADVVRSPLVTIHRLDALLVRRAIDIGTSKLLRAGDAVYVAVSEVTGGKVVSWDEELLRRAAAVTPEAWLKRKPSEEDDQEGEEATEGPGP